MKLNEPLARVSGITPPITSGLRFCLLASLLLLTAAASAQQKPDLGQMSIEDLMQIKVTSVGKREQALSTAAAAVYVITQEDIRRSGASTIPDALRLAPGVQVAQMSSKSWAVTIRGGNSAYANKLLVLIDGRSIYSPSYSGVFWDEHDLLLEDIDRIEVIRGPGATLWGTNAVNGVINIITRSAAETQGVLATAGTGSYDRGFGSARYGGSAGRHGHYRFYGKYAHRYDLVSPTGKSALDSWASGRLGFRSDWTLGSADSLTVQGDLYRGSIDHDLLNSLPSPEYAALLAGVSPFRGGSLLTRWQRVLAVDSQITAQVYYDDDRQAIPVLYLRNRAVDFDFQHNLRWGKHELVWGGGFRSISQYTDGTPLFRFDPPNRTYHLFSGFAQDEVELLPHRLKLALGSKFESNEFTGVEIQPNVRVMVQPSSQQVLWFSVARAARSPSELETSVQGQIPGFLGVPAAIEILGNPKVRAEDLLAYEAGYRVEVRRRVSLDFAAFSNRYQHLMAYEMAAEQPGFPNVIRLTLGNGVARRAHGIEVTTAFALQPWWRLTGSYTWLHSTEEQTSRDLMVISPAKPGDDPQHQFQAHSYCSLPRDLEFDTGVFFVDKLPAQGVPRFTRVDARLGWRPSEQWEFSVVGQNLLDPTHLEFFKVGEQAAPALVRRSLYGKITWRF